MQQTRTQPDQLDHSSGNARMTYLPGRVFPRHRSVLLALSAQARKLCKANYRGIAPSRPYLFDDDQLGCD